MSYAILITLFFFSLYIGYGMLVTEYKKELRTILFDIFLIVSFSVWGIYILMFLGEYKKMEMFFYIFFVAVSIFTIYKIYLLSLKKPLNIVARQQSYWGVKASQIYKKYDWKLDFRKDRIEVKNNPLEKQIYRQYSNNSKYITGNIFLAMRDLEFTYADDISEINSELYKTIIKKYEEILKELELKNEFNNLLKENGNCVEFFLISCWVMYTKRINLGIATLDVLVKNFTEYELLGALDNATLNSVKRHGAAMYFKYAEFKNLRPDVSETKENEDDENDEDDFF